MPNSKFNFVDGSTKGIFKFMVNDSDSIDVIFKCSNDGHEWVETPETKILVKAGVLDIEPLRKAYITKLKNKDEIDRLQKIEEWKKRYDAEWVHGTDHYEGIEVEITSFENVLNRDFYREPTLKAIYKGVKCEICYVDVSNSRYGSPNMKYQILDHITDYKRKNYSTYEKAIIKIKELVDAKIAREERKQKDNNERTEAAKTMSKILGILVVAKSGFYHPRHGGRGYATYKYVTKIKGKDIEIAKYDKSWSFGEFKDLSVEDIKAIIEIVK